MVAVATPPVRVARVTDTSPAGAIRIFRRGRSEIKRFLGDYGVRGADFRIKSPFYLPTHRPGCRFGILPKNCNPCTAFLLQFGSREG